MSDVLADILPVITRHMGDVHDVAHVEFGHRADVKATVQAARGRFFVKAYREDNPDVADPREVALNPHIRGIGPALIAYERAPDWIILVYEHVDGRHCDLRPASPDIAKAIAVVDAIGRIQMPEQKFWPRRAWRGVATPGEVELISGDSLLHSDLNPENILVNHRTWVVDWSSPTRGAAVVNLAELVTQLIAAGHTPEEAEVLVGGCDAWAQADTATLDTLARVNLRMHRKWDERRPGWRARFPEDSWQRAISPAVEDWAAYRKVLEPPRR